MRSYSCRRLSLLAVVLAGCNGGGSGVGGAGGHAGNALSGGGHGGGGHGGGGIAGNGGASGKAGGETGGGGGPGLGGRGGASPGSEGLGGETGVGGVPGLGGPGGASSGGNGGALGIGGSGGMASGGHGGAGGGADRGATGGGGAVGAGARGGGGSSGTGGAGGLGVAGGAGGGNAGGGGSNGGVGGAVISGVGGAAGGSSATNCTGHGVGGTSGTTLISIAGSLGQLVIDSTGSHIYVSNMSLNQIEDYSLIACALQTPIAVGSRPFGLDISVGDIRLYVPNSGEKTISVVDIASRHELRKIEVPSTFSDDRPYSLAIANNGKAFFSTTFPGSGFGGRMLSLDLVSEVVSPRADFYERGTTSEGTILMPSADRSAIVTIAGDITSGPVFMYRTSTDTFGQRKDLLGFLDDIAVNGTGTSVVVSYRGGNATPNVHEVAVLDGNLNLLGMITGGPSFGAAFAPAGTKAYRATATGIQILDTSSFVVTGSLPVADTLHGASDRIYALGSIAVTPDGRLLAAITDHGISLVSLP